HSLSLSPPSLTLYLSLSLSYSISLSLLLTLYSTLSLTQPKLSLTPSNLHATLLSFPLPLSSPICLSLSLSLAPSVFWLTQCTVLNLFSVTQYLIQLWSMSVRLFKSSSHEHTHT